MKKILNMNENISTIFFSFLISIILLSQFLLGPDIQTSSKNFSDATCRFDFHIEGMPKSPTNFEIP